MSDSVRPHRWQPNRLCCPWDSLGKNTGVGCHFLLQCMKVKSESEIAQSCPTLHDPMGCSPPGSSIHGIFQARVLEWGAIAFSVTWVKPSLFFGCKYFVALFSILPNASCPFLNPILICSLCPHRPEDGDERCSKKNDTKEVIYKTEKLTGTENKLMITKGDSWGWGRKDKLEVWK